MLNNIEQTCKRIEKEFYIHKPFKKKVFLSAIKSLSLFLKAYEHILSNPSTRAKITRLCYIYFREIDDLIDGDKRLATVSSDFNDNKKILTEYMYQRRMYLENGCISNKPNELDEIIKVITALSNDLGLDLKDNFLKLLDCMLFDLNRKCDLKNGVTNFSLNSEMDEYYFKYYYDSCIKIAILLMTSNFSNPDSKDIRDLGYAQRIYFNLEDFFEDLSYGLINISREDINDLGISEQSLINIARLPKETIELCKKRGFNHPEVSKFIADPIMFWLDQQLDLGIQYLNVYQENAPLRSIYSIGNELLFQRNDFSEVVLRLGIERGTNNYLSKLLKQRTR